MNSPLGKAIVKEAQRSTDMVLKQGTITAVAGRLCTVTVDGQSVPGIRALDHVALAENIGCWLMFMGSGRWIVFGTTRDFGGSYPVGGFPAGSVIDYMGELPPPGWVLVAGQTIVNAENLYPEFWAAIPANLKSGSDAVLPDSRGRVGAGYNSGDTDFNLIGKTGGAKTHALNIAELAEHNHGINQTASGAGNTGNESANHAHSGNTGNQNANHTHSGNTGNVSADHSHGITNGTAVVRGAGGGVAYLLNGAQGLNVFGPYNTYTLSTGGISTNHTHAFTTGGNSASHSHAFNTNNQTALHTHGTPNHTHTIGMSNTGSGSGHNNLQPFVTLAKMVYLG